MVVRKNVLEYITALVFAKNKVRLKRFLDKFQIWQSSIVQINLSITSLRLISNFDQFSTINVNKILNWYDLNMYIINVIADDETKIGLYEIYFLND
jgi:hypothetical protein